MRRILIGLVAVSLCMLAAETSLADEKKSAAHKGEAKADAAPKKIELPPGGKTETKGKLPPVSLAGYWLEVDTLKISDKDSVQRITIFRFAKGKDGWVVHELRPTLPIDQQQAFGAKYDAMRSKHETFVPPQEQVDAFTKALREQPPALPDGYRALHFLVAPAQFDKQQKGRPQSQGAKFLIEDAVEIPGLAPYGSSLYVKEISPDMITGDVHFAQVNQGYQGQMIPLALDGTFRMQRLDVPPPVVRADGTVGPAAADQASAAPQAAGDTSKQ